MCFPNFPVREGLKKSHTPHATPRGLQTGETKTELALCTLGSSAGCNRERALGNGDSGLRCVRSGTASPALCWGTSWKKRGRFWLLAEKSSPRLTPDYTMGCHHTKPCTLGKEVGTSFAGGESPGLTELSSGQTDARRAEGGHRGGAMLHVPCLCAK